MPFIQTPFITSNDGHGFKPIAARALGFIASAGGKLWAAMFPDPNTEDASGRAEAEFIIPNDYVSGDGISIEIDTTVVDASGNVVPAGTIQLDAYVERYDGGWIRLNDNTTGPDHFTVPGTTMLIYFVGGVDDIAPDVTTTSFAIPASATFDFQNPAAGGWVTMAQPSFDNSGNPIPQTVTDIGWTMLDDSDPGTGTFDLQQTHAVMNYAFQNDTPYLLDFGVPTQNYGILAGTNVYAAGDKINILVFCGKGTTDGGGNNYLILGVRVVVGGNSYNVPFGIPDDAGVDNVTWVGPGFNGSNDYIPIETVEDPAHAISDQFLNVDSFTFPTVAPVPTNSRVPAIDGSATFGSTLSIVDFGFWEPWIYNYHVQWFDNTTPISGAHGQTYVTSAGQIGHSISVKVQARSLAKVLSLAAQSNAIVVIGTASFLLTEAGDLLTQENGGLLEI